MLFVGAEGDIPDIYGLPSLSWWWSFHLAQSRGVWGNDELQVSLNGYGQAAGSRGSSQ